jgi:hypothetical protein
MTDAASPPETSHRPTWKPKKKRGPGTGKPAPAVIISGANFDEHFPPPPKKVGAPSKYTEEIGEQICKWVGDGKSLRSFCLQEGTPELQTVYNWQDAHPQFFEKYARARDKGFDVLAELTRDGANDPNIAPEDVQRAKLGFEANKWYLSKVAHRRYGDRLDVRQEITGPGGGPLQAHVLLDVLLTPANLERLDDIEIAAIRSAAAKLALPAPSHVIEAVATPIAEAVAGVAYGALRGDAEALDEAEPADDTPSDE